MFGIRRMRTEGVCMAGGGGGGFHRESPHEGLSKRTFLGAISFTYMRTYTIFLQNKNLLTYWLHWTNMLDYDQ